MTNFSDQTQNSTNAPNADSANADQPNAVQQIADRVEATPEKIETAVNQAPEKVETAVNQVPDQIESVKSTLTQPLPTPPAMSDSEAAPEELLKRLNWGEPALTIFDVRSREAFNDERITGAVSMPMGQVPTEATLEYSRNIYVYADSNDDAAEAAQRLRQAGYTAVAQLQGGLSAWKAIGGATEGIKAFSSPALS